MEQEGAQRHCERMQEPELYENRLKYFLHLSLRLQLILCLHNMCKGLGGEKGEKSGPSCARGCAFKDLGEDDINEECVYGRLNELVLKNLVHVI